MATRAGHFVSLPEAAIVALDLDRTLIYSATAAGDARDLPPLRVVEYLEGVPLSRMTEGAWALLGGLMKQAEVVLVTTRSQVQFARVRLPATPRYALCANGGVLLVTGVRDPEWDQWARTIMATSAPLETVLALMDEVRSEPWVKDVRSIEGLLCYLVAHDPGDLPAEWLRTFSRSVGASGWKVSVQGRKVLAVPEGLSKASGLLRLRDRIVMDLRARRAIGPQDRVRLFASGDSILDAAMLEAVDLAVRPAHGELHDLGWSADGVHVTDLAGARAGEEIIAWLIDRVGADRE